MEGATMSPIIETIAWGAGIAGLSVILVGLRRLPWGYTGLVGLGMGTVFAAVRLATLDASFEAASAVLIGAIGGSLATIGTERGERARARRSAAILAGHP